MSNQKRLKEIQDKVSKLEIKWLRERNNATKRELNNEIKKLEKEFQELQRSKDE